jgi:hypothetical protein
MSNTRFIVCLSLLLTLTSLGVQAAVEQNNNSPLWLSGNPPTKELMKQFSRAHGGMVIRDEERNYSKMLWLRAGTDFKNADYLANKTGQFYLLDQKLNPSKPTASLADPDHTAIKFKMPDEGYYNAYYLEQVVRDGVRYVDVAKNEVLKHNCGLGHNFDVEQHRPQSDKRIPLEILRLRFDDETYHTRFNSGKNVLFKVLYNGEPLAGATATISTEEGWSRNSKSDAEGIVAFQVIQDRFQENEEKKEHKKGGAEGGRHGRTRRSEQFLVTVQHAEKVEGEYNGQPYQKTLFTSTFPGQFSASQSVYKSYAYGLTFSSAGILVLGVGSYLYRRRRIKPFKEVNLDE